jgi:hypothetical protein
MRRRSKPRRNGRGDRRRPGRSSGWRCGLGRRNRCPPVRCRPRGDPVVADGDGEGKRGELGDVSELAVTFAVLHGVDAAPAEFHGSMTPTSSHGWYRRTRRGSICSPAR